MGQSLSRLNDAGRLHITVTTKPISIAAKEKLPAVTYILNEDELGPEQLHLIFKQLIKTLESHVSD